MINFSLKDKIALVTGASRGIGRAIALALAGQGAVCIVVSRKLEELDRVVGEIREAGGRAEAMACNIGIMTEIESMFANLREKHAHLDILVNNAATNPYFGEMAGAEEWAWEKTIAVNLKGPFFIIQKAVPLMEAAGGGAIVNIASVGGLHPAPFQGIYSITKGGLITMTKAYAKELAGRGIRVNALLPGLTYTDFSKVLIENKEIYDYAVQRIPLGRHAEPEEMVGAVLYLVSSASSYTTGSCIVCDGGMIA